jgi:hypothetical protein
MSRTSDGTIKKRALYSALSIVLVLAAPLAGRVLGTTWGAVKAYRTATAMFHNRQIALRISGQVFKDAYWTYVYGR